MVVLYCDQRRNLKSEDQQHNFLCPRTLQARNNVNENKLVVRFFKDERQKGEPMGSQAHVSKTVRSAYPTGHVVLRMLPPKKLCANFTAEKKYTSQNGQAELR